jgi:hypothetical protein
MVIELTLRKLHYDYTTGDYLKNVKIFVGEDGETKVHVSNVIKIDTWGTKENTSTIDIVIEDGSEVTFLDVKHITCTQY